MDGKNMLQLKEGFNGEYKMVLKKHGNYQERKLDGVQYTIQSQLH